MTYKYIEKPYTLIHIEISGICNAKCPYCVTGYHNQNNGGFINPDILEKILIKLIDTGLYNFDSTYLGLYSWGEAFLHPEFPAIINLLNKYKMRYIFSSNASIVPKIDGNFVKNLNDLKFSMPGFSQNSYDKIHGFNFEKIKSNISEIVTKLKKNNYTGKITILYHVYQFNVDEMVECDKFASQLEIDFTYYYAYMNDWWRLKNMAEGKLDYDELNQISKDLFNNSFWETIKKEESYDCPYWDNYFTIDENGEVATCCMLPTNHPDYSCGNFLQDELEKILFNKRNKAVCNECISSGIYHQCCTLNIPEFYGQLKNVTNKNTFSNLMRKINKSACEQIYRLINTV